jgi:hypothetical protein
VGLDIVSTEVLAHFANVILDANHGVSWVCAARQLGNSNSNLDVQF